MVRLYTAAIADLLALLRSGSRGRRVLFSAGLILIGSGLFHFGIFVWEKGTWEGPLSWRKPILFGLSGGATALSVGWVVSLVAEGAPDSKWIKRFEPWFCVLFALAMLAEVGLITLQTWRGEASHFNETTPFNTTIFYLIGIFTIYGALSITALTAVAMGPLPEPGDRALAARLGMLLLLLACGLGYWILQYGVERVQQGLSPETYGAHGVMKFPHGLPLHSIQYLALQSWLMRYAKISPPWRIRWIGAGAAGLLLMTIFGMMQTLGGRARFELTFVSALVLGISLFLFALPFVATGLAWMRNSLSWRARQSS